MQLNQSMLKNDLPDGFPDVRDTGDQAAYIAGLDIDIALLKHQAENPNISTGRLILNFCEECGNKIEPGRQKAKILGHITTCIVCASEIELKEKLFGKVY